jgi:hypothetical protein
MGDDVVGTSAALIGSGLRGLDGDLRAERAVDGAAVGDLDEATVLIGQGALAGFAVLDRRAPARVQRNLQPGSRCTLHHKTSAF